MSWLREAVAEGPILADGAMGTMLMDAGLAPGANAELWNVERPEAVEAIQRQYVEAGSRLVSANTFGGCPLALARHGLAARAAELNAAGVRIARRAAHGRAWVLGDVGPFGGFLEPYGETSPEELAEALRCQVQAFLDAGADGVIVETMSDPAEMAIAVEAAKRVAGWPVLASYAFQRTAHGFRTMMGTGVEEAVAAALSAGADAVGANCGTGLTPADYEELASEVVAAAGGCPALLQPNAGSPGSAGGGASRGMSPEDAAGWACRAVAAGVRIVGGCCGTAPAHVRAMAEALGA